MKSKAPVDIKRGKTFIGKKDGTGAKRAPIDEELSYIIEKLVNITDNIDYSLRLNVDGYYL